MSKTILSSSPSSPAFSLKEDSSSTSDKLETIITTEVKPKTHGATVIFDTDMNTSACPRADDAPELPPEEDWQSHPLSIFCQKYRGRLVDDAKLPRNVRTFYRNQDKIIEDLETTVSLLNCDEECQNKIKEMSRKQQRANSILIKTTFLFNLLLVVGKLIASILSNSLSVISSLMDSIVDLSSGITLWVTARQIRKRMPYKYPAGRTRLEPIAVVILSVIMASVSVQLMIQAAQTLYEMAAKNRGPPEMSNLTIGLIASTIVIKAFLCFLCWKFGRGESIAALKNDQFNDTLSNSVALISSTISARVVGVPYLKYFDPAGALIIGAYIIYSWWKMGAEHARNLTGHSAEPAFIQKLTFIAVNHHPSIERLETVRAMHFGNHFLVEVDIVLPHDMDLHQAHDIGETLQQKLETLPDVERAFVHLDYDWDHHPLDEHKLV